jgi:hypothetical protein
MGSIEGKTVAIVAMGKSCTDYVLEAAVQNSRSQIADEIWAINAMGDVIYHDRLFIMDDLRVFVHRMAERKPWYTDWMKTHQKPIYTSVDYPEFPSSIAYPLQEVINDLENSHYFNSTVAYAVAYAIHRKVSAIKLYGADFTYPNVHTSESGRGCVEFLLGVAHARGIRIDTAGTTTLLDTNVPKEHKLYGYIRQPSVDMVSGQFQVKLSGGVDYEEIKGVHMPYGRYALTEE